MNNNPLQQYFRRPAVFIRLPSNGAGYAPGVVNIPESGELPVYPMTAIDEITSRTPDSLFNGTAVAELIKSCVPDIKQPWEINNTDMDAILIGIRIASGNEEIELSTKCPACNSDSTYTISLMAILSQLKSPDYNKELQLRDLVVKFRPISYKEMNAAGLAQFEIQKQFSAMNNETDDNLKLKKSQELVKQVTDATMKIIATSIEYIKTPTVVVDDKNYIYEFLANCDSTTYTTIRDYQADLKAQTDIKPLLIKCPDCSHEYQQEFTLNMTDFFG